MSVFVSAGVYVVEHDNSLYTPAISPTSIGIIGTATKGALNTPTLITNEGQMVDTFGIPRTKDYGMQTAIQALKACRIIYFCRIAGAAATNGAVTAQDSGSGPTNPSFGPSANVGPYNLAAGSTFSLTRDGPTTHVATVAALAASRTTGASLWDFTTIAGWGPGGAPLTITIDRETAAQVITFLPGDFANPAAANALEVARVLNTQLHKAHATYSGTGAIAGDTVSIITDRLGTGAYVNILAVGAVSVQTLLGFTAGETATTAGNVSDADAVTATEIKTMIELLGGGTVYTVTVGITGGIASITRQGAGGAGVQLTIDSVSTGIGASPLVNITPLNTMRSGTAGGAAANTITLTAATKGSHSSDITVTVTDSSALGGTKKLVVKYRGITVETFDKLWKNASTPIPVGAYPMIATLNAGSTDGTYPASVFITATDAGAPAYNPANGIYTLSAGNDGDNWTDATVIGTTVAGVSTGLQGFANPEKIYINVLATPGISYASVISAGLSLCTARADCIFVADAPKSLDVQKAVQWHNGDATAGAVTVDQELRTETNTTQFNSSYGAAYWPFVQVFDAYNDSEIWLPPSAIVLRTYAYTDQVADPWFAPAGPNRSQSLSVLDLEMSPTQGERDLMQQPGNNLNPIANIAGSGVTIMGQKTLQRAPTALDRVNVRRMLLVIEKAIATASFFLVFEPNDSIMWRRFVNLVTPMLDDVKARRGLYDFRVVADSSTTTSLMIDQNTFVGKIFLKPTKTAEILIVSFNLVPTGANFDEFAQA